MDSNLGSKCDVVNPHVSISYSSNTEDVGKTDDSTNSLPVRSSKDWNLYFLYFAYLFGTSTTSVGGPSRLAYFDTNLVANCSAFSSVLSISGISHSLSTSFISSLVSPPTTPFNHTQVDWYILRISIAQNHCMLMRSSIAHHNKFVIEWMREI